MSKLKRRAKRLVQQGEVYGLLTVLGLDTAKTTVGRKWFSCRCECGKVISIRSVSLSGGNSKSCGCRRRIGVIAAARRRATHGQSLGYKMSKLYQAYLNMMRRCYDRKCDMFPRYGGRGIDVCQRWKNDRSAFFADLGSPPTKEHSIDRIENDKGYWCGRAECSDCGPRNRALNVKWSAQEEQARNKSSNRCLTLNGETLTIAEWAERTGIDRGTIECRIYLLMWPVEKALSQGVRKAKTITHNGETLTVEEWAARSGVAASTIHLRISRLKWDEVKAITTPSRQRAVKRCK